MTTQETHRWPTVIRTPLTAALWVVSASGWTLLLLTDQAPHTRSAYIAAAIISAMLACTRTAIARMRLNVVEIADRMERSDAVNAALADAVTITAFRNHADINHAAASVPYPLTDLENLRPAGWSRDFYYDCARRQALSGGDAPNVVPMIREHSRRTAS